MKFTKMNGCGNDYVYINGFEETIKNSWELARKMSNRNFGIGSDGLVLILPSKKADFRMRMFNSDGSEAEMCGNAIRCVGKYVYDKGMTQKTSLRIETLAGIKGLELTIKNREVFSVRVDMGEPILEAKKIPVRSNKSPVIEEEIRVDSGQLILTAVSMGNPHAIIMVEDVENCDFERVGRVVEHHPLFPQKTNVEFVQILDKEHIKMRVWERGVGETLACGTGACASLVACVLKTIANRKAMLHLRGGDLTIEWDQETNHVFMTGTCETVFEGIWLK